ncbi:SMP-30/gluconolactonase/LRE family protein [Ruegeria sp. PrR005]|uniref:SMP-30/gluconolactonase/LRE family protein n=1 Tax=Ruegeria sp. PrR005 TaxID=2706882 RepID=A0A6B2NJ07_9RHOB|nr:SMP-30/gluconolactonase/LRE family protein [Ruegeria sp. PrR005]NDW44172.1 SMP-30/gluconolactonase/LRE family protein [Ruegeria sp. PrR005]
MSDQRTIEDGYLEPVAEGLGFPEGPVAMNDGSVLFVDIKDQLLRRLTPENKIVNVAKLPGGPNGVAIGPDGAAYVCNNGGVYTFVKIDPLAPTGSGKTPNPEREITVPWPERPNYEGGSIQRVDLDTGEVKTLYCKYKGKCLIAPDDIVFDSDGGFWFTDTGMQEGTTTESGAVYYAKTDGTMLNQVALVPTANGIGISPEGDKLYVSDTVFGRLWSMEIVGCGELKKPNPVPPMPGKVVQTLPGYQWLDSLKVEADGRVCVGTIFNGGITIFSLDGTTQHLPVDDIFTTNLCFGGEDMCDVWITASSTGKIYKTRWPRPGLKLAFTA